MRLPTPSPNWRSFQSLSARNEPVRAITEVASLKHVSPAGAAVAVPLTPDLAQASEVAGRALTPVARRDLLPGLVAIKYTQSNSVGYALDGQMIGIGAGQPSRVDCTKLAGAKADLWWLGTHPKVLGLRFKPGVKKQDRINWRVRYIEGDLTRFEEQALQDALDTPLDPLKMDERHAWMQQLSGVSMVSDGFIPFRDNIDHASKHGVRFIAEPGGSARDKDVEDACREYGMALVHTGFRLFHH